MNNLLLKAILKPVADYCFDYLKDEKKMESVWAWVDEKAESTETAWDDTAAAIVKQAFPQVVAVAEDFVKGLLK